MSERSETRRTLDAIWRIEGAQVVATVARVVGDLGLAEDLAQDALAEALDQWPGSGIPRNPGAWLTSVAKRRAIDGWRRRERLDDRYRAIGRDLSETVEHDWEPIRDDVLKLVFAACHPVLSRDARVVLTLRVVAGLSSEEISRLLLVPVSTVQQRVVRAKRSLAAARVPFEIPETGEWPERLGAVTSVVYLMFTEGYAASSGEEWVRRDIADETLRLGRILVSLVPREAEVHALLALMELQASRFAARRGVDGAPVLLEDQDRRRWDRGQIDRGVRALERADALGRGRGPYALQAAIAACHARASSVEETDWHEIVALYEALEQVTRNPVVTVNRAVAMAMASGPLVGLRFLDDADLSALRSSYLVPSVRGELLRRAGRRGEAAEELRRAVELLRDGPQRRVIEAKLAALAPT
ncbi:sigma-70 family RNA polymerase sigma factor [Aeromicrobium sp. YIM 150415]|uniref:RNA polymerase sigma factor n=1 Tax=Aeromicrobium sp. YIM 150415 TaxID=2803912 RepID=UPI001963EB83|nr:sigma-70 family RNA polymerase sigma factor [Aeromicrobium sp. YIM 150415]MBM9465329.1 sigma-70 family RNA polymerase sigma factor [Aeromicrobium sp. YIM 150415]